MADLHADFRADVPLSQAARTALDEVCALFGMSAVVSPAVDGAVTLHCQRAGLDALNRHVWEAGERQGDYLGHQGEAELAVRAALGRFSERDPATLASLHNLANCYEAAGRLRESRALFSTVLEARRDVLGVDDRETLVTQNDLGLVMQACGDADEARRLHEDTLGLRRRLLGPLHRETLSSMNNLAVALSGLGETGAATALMRQVLEAREAKFGSDHRETLMAVNNVAACLVATGEIEAARVQFARAWHGFEALVGRDHRDTLTARHNLAWCHQTLGEYRIARSHHLQLVARCRDALGERHPDTLMSERNLAKFLVASGDPAEALEIVDRVHAIQLEVLGHTHDDTLKSLEMYVELGRDLDRSDWADKAKSFFADVGRAPRNSGAWPALVAAAAEYLDEMAERTDVLSGQLARLSRGLLEAYDLSPSDKRERIGEAFMRFHRSWLTFCTRRNADDIPIVLSAMHGREINALMLGEWEVRQPDRPQHDPRGRFELLRRSLIDLRVQLEWLGDGADRRQLEIRHDTLLGEYRDLHRALAAQYPRFYSSDAPLVTADALRNNLDAHETVVLLFLAATPDGDGALDGFAACVSREGVGVCALPGLFDCVALARRAGRASLGHRRIVGLNPHDDEPDADSPDGGQICRAMTEMLWKRLHDLLPEGVRDLHIVTHDTLHGLPVEHGSPDGVRTFVYPGLVFLANSFARAQRAGAGTLPGDASITVHVDAGEQGSSIPFVIADAQIVRQLWPGISTRTPAVSIGAATHALWQPGAPQCDAWHFACHGTEIAKPRRQTVLTLGTGAWLDAASVLASGQAPRLAVLGACVVGRVRESPTGEPLGLLSGLFLAGADYVVAPVHPVPDFWMPLLMTLFYQSLAAGLDPARALKVAKQRLANGNWYADTSAILQNAFAAALECWLPADPTGRSLPADTVDVMTRWHLPDDLAALLGGRDALRSLGAMTARPDGRRELAARLVAHLYATRQRVPAEIALHLALWVRGFGKPFANPRQQSTAKAD